MTRSSGGDQSLSAAVGILGPMAVVMPTGRPLTIEDLDRFPCDGNRYELIQGSLHVNPAPSLRHQVVSSRLAELLTGACPPAHHVLTAPFDVALGPDTMVQPDLVVVRTADIVHFELVAPPVLVIEILSPTTNHYDRGSKALAYAASDIQHYWIVDPEKPSIQVFDWSGAGTEQLVTADERLAVTDPFAVEIVPSALLRLGGANTG